MVYLKEKRVGKRKYLYLTRSVRLPNGKVKTLQKLLSNAKDEGTAGKTLDELENRAFADWARGAFGTDDIFTDETLAGIEGIRLGFRRILRKLSKNQRRDLFDRFTANFTYESNALEGNSLTLKDVSIVMFEKGALLRGKGLREIYETVNSRKVVEGILAGKFRVDERSVLKMHRMLVANMDIPPGYKTVPNFLLGRKVETTSPERVGAEMAALFRRYSESRGKVHPLRLAADIHGRFERIHPFEDGNGRVGRFLINVALVGEGYPPLIIRRSQKAAYLNVLEKYDAGQARPLERFLLEKYKETYGKFFEVFIRYLN